MAACQGTRSLPSVSLTPALASEHSNRSKSWLCTHVGLPSRFKSQGVRHLFGIKDEPLCRKSVETRARLGGDGDVDLNGEAIAEDFYSVLGLVGLAHPFPENILVLLRFHNHTDTKCRILKVASLTSS